MVFKNSNLSRTLNPFQLSSCALQPLCSLRNFNIYQSGASIISRGALNQRAYKLHVHGVENSIQGICAG